jgi:hypothetical protein
VLHIGNVVLAVDSGLIVRSFGSVLISYDPVQLSYVASGSLGSILNRILFLT